MDGTTNRFECLPKTAAKAQTTKPYHDTGDAVDAQVQAVLKTPNADYDPLNGGIFVDLYDAFDRNDLGDLIDKSCEYEYECGEPEPGGPPEHPQKPVSGRQISFNIGFIDPPSTDIDAIGICCTRGEIVESSSSGGESSGGLSSLGLSSDSSDGESSLSSDGESSLSSDGVTESESSLSISTTSLSFSTGLYNSSTGEPPSGCPPIAVTVVTALDVTSSMQFNFKQRVIYVECAEEESGWLPVPGWETTDCPDEE
jgi:hypothetical protein